MPRSNNKLYRITETYQQQGPGGLARWAGKWLYWRGGLYHGTIWLETQRRERRYRKKIKRYGIQDPVVLFQMGKVGSSTMSASLTPLKLNVPVFTFHTLTDFDAHEEFIKQHSVDPTWPLQILAQSRAHSKLLFNGRWKKFNVISLVRSPVNRTVSAFFEHWNTSNPEFQARNAAGTLEVETLTREFATQYFHDTAEQWFDSQMLPVFGIDVFAEPFDPARGYQIYHGENAQLLVLRLEDLRRVATPAMQEFLNIPNFSLRDSNVSESKGYGEIYRRFVETARLPQDLVAKIQSSRYARNFYSAAELDQEARFWTRA